MSEKITLALNSLDLLKHVLFKGYVFPEAVAELNLTQERILMTVRNSPPLPMVTIARAIGLEKGPFSQTVDKLVARQLVQRVRSSSDKRLVFLELTPLGIQFAECIEESMEAHFSQRMQGLSPEQRQAFFDALATLQKTATHLITP